ncbi:hypothetical protein CDD83_11141 [Cordyceps sp. RAO-2017]|nr:hypothetical protein CDD83_11141 [Cordyceps sp. RAO-2017]
MQRTTPASATTPTFPPPLLNLSLFSPTSPSSSKRPATRDGSSDPLRVHPGHGPGHGHNHNLYLPPPPPVPGSSGSRKASASSFTTTISSSSRKLSFSAASPFGRRRSSASSPASASFQGSFVTDAAAPPALPDYALPAAARVQQGRAPGHHQHNHAGASPDAAPTTMPSRTLTATTAASTVSSSPSAVPAAPSYMPPPTPVVGSGVNGGGGGGAGGGGGGGLSSASSSAAPAVASATASSSSIWQPSEASVIHQQIMELAHKRISTLDYLRKAHEGRVYWFNTYLFDRPDLARMPYFDPRKLARRATNFLLLGLSVPTINDLYSSSAIEFLRCLNALLSEFDSFQQLHGDSSAASLTRARLPNMFRRPGGKSRRSASAADLAAAAAADDASQSSSLAAAPGGAGASTTPSVMTFAAAESDLLPGEEYTYLLTPSLPFEPDFFETFATLCDVLIDSYTRFLALVPTPRECSAPVAELFSKADAKLRKIVVQGAVKEFEDHSRSQVKAEVASIGKVVLGGLM